MDDKAHHYSITAKGIEGLIVHTGSEVDIPALGMVNVNVDLRAERKNLPRPSQPVMFTIQADDDAAIVREAKSSFLR